MADRKDLREQRADKDRSTMNVERKTQVYQEMIDKLKSERYEYQRQNYILKRRAEEAERKFYDAKIKARQSNGKAQPRLSNKEYTPTDHRRPRSAAEAGSLFNSSVVHSESIRKPNPSLNPKNTNTDQGSSERAQSIRDFNTRSIKEVPGNLS
jgi:hypothetical protein